MGQGPSSHSRNSHVNGTRRGLPSRSSTIINSNGSIVNTDPNPLHHPDPENDPASSGATSHNINNNRVPSPLESATYLNQRKSTSSLSKIFNRKWKKRRGSISASFSINENEIKVRSFYCPLAKTILHAVPFIYWLVSEFPPLNILVKL